MVTIRPPYGEQKPEIYRSFDFGNLLSVHMLDTRVIGRDKQLSYGDYRDEKSKQIDLQRFVQDLNQPERTLLGKKQKALYCLKNIVLKIHIRPVTRDKLQS